MSENGLVATVCDAAIARRRYMRDYQRRVKGVVIHTCEFCGEGEVAGQRRFCSRTCSDAWRRRASARRTWVCRVCGAEFCRAPWVAKPSLVCSDDCRRFVVRAKPFRISPTELWELYWASRGCCQACGRPFNAKAIGPGKSSWVIDHDHVSGFVRGLLHHQCNTGLGMASHDPEELEAWANYLRCGPWIEAA